MHHTPSADTGTPCGRAQHSGNPATEASIDDKEASGVNTHGVDTRQGRGYGKDKCRPEATRSVNERQSSTQIRGPGESFVGLTLSKPMSEDRQETCRSTYHESPFPVVLCCVDLVVWRERECGRVRAGRRWPVGLPDRRAGPISKPGDRRVPEPDRAAPADRLQGQRGRGAGGAGRPARSGQARDLSGRHGRGAGRGRRCREASSTGAMCIG